MQRPWFVLVLLVACGSPPPSTTCSSNADCDRGLVCTAGRTCEQGVKCTTFNDCRPGFFCIASICTKNVPAPDSGSTGPTGSTGSTGPVRGSAQLCDPCALDTDCAQDGMLCIPVSGQTVCGQPCDASGACPWGFKCQPSSSQCIPISGSCAPISGGCLVPPRLVTPAFGANLKASFGFYDSETTFTVDPQGHVAIGYITTTNSGDSRMAIAYAASPAGPFLDAHTVPPASAQSASDPTLDYDSAGRMYYAWLQFDRIGTGQEMADGGFYVAVSDDHGATWPRIALASDPNDDPRGTTQMDKPWLNVDRANDLIHLAYAVDTSVGQQLHMTTSPDHGATWGSAVQMSIGTSCNSNLVSPQIDGTGIIYAAWSNYCTGGDNSASSQNQIAFTKSSDHGQSFSPAIQVSGNELISFAMPSLAIAPDGTLYVAYLSGASPNTDIVVARSDDHGVSWLPSVKVNDFASGCAEAKLPWVNVDPQNNVHVAWLDNRYGASAGTAIWSMSADKGQTWRANRVVSDQPFRFNGSHDAAGDLFLGDYLGLGFFGGEVLFAWTDPRDGTSKIHWAHGPIPAP